MTSVQMCRADAATTSFNACDPAAVIETQYKMKMPDAMKADFARVYQAEQQGGQATARAVWDCFKKTYIQPAQTTSSYVTHQAHVFTDGDRFVSVKCIENDEMTCKDGPDVRIEMRLSKRST